MAYRIRIEQSASVPDTEAKWQRGGPTAKDAESCAYEMPPAGAMKHVRTDIYDQVLEELDVAGLVHAINTPGGFGNPPATT